MSNDFEIELLKNFLMPFLVAIISYYLLSSRAEMISRKNYSLLGAELLSTLIEEVETGKHFIKKALDPKDDSFPYPLPRKSWTGINSIPDEVLLRILRISEGEPLEGFSLNRIRTHCKNYFEHIVVNWDQVYNEANQMRDYKLVAISLASYEDATDNVLKMLVQAQRLLEENSKKCFPG